MKKGVCRDMIARQTPPYFVQRFGDDDYLLPSNSLSFGKMLVAQIS